MHGSCLFEAKRSSLLFVVGMFEFAQRSRLLKRKFMLKPLLTACEIQ